LPFLLFQQRVFVPYFVTQKQRYEPIANASKHYFSTIFARAFFGVLGCKGTTKI
jgi:hypothetical protein